MLAFKNVHCEVIVLKDGKTRRGHGVEDFMVSQ